MKRTFNLADIFELVVQAVPDRTAFGCGDQKLSFKQPVTTWNVHALRKAVVNGSVGFGVMTPFRAETGQLLLVQRGWNAEPTSIALPATSTTITVRVQAVQADGPMRPDDLPSGQINWIDPTELAAGRSHDSATFDLVDPIPNDLVALPAPTTSSGPHVGYTVHWILIGIAAIIIYIRLLRSELYGVDEN